MSNVGRHVELKGLQTRLERSKSELKVLEEERREVDKRISATRAKIAQLENEIRKIQEAPVVILSEHAILRYLERVKKVDLDQIRQEILTPDIIKTIAHFHGGSIPHPDGFTIQVRENTITTIVTDEQFDP